MAVISLGENKWRMIRRVVHKKSFRYADARNQTRQDQEHFDWLVANGFVVADQGERFALTEKGKAAADLGQYDWEPGAAPTPPARQRRTVKTAR